jgi:hypothetical protein
MDIIACTGSFFLGGVTAVTVMGLFLLFIDHPPRRSNHSKYHEKIATALLPLIDSKAAEDLPQGSEMEATGVLSSSTGQDPMSPSHREAPRRWGKEYIPACELLQ